MNRKILILVEGQTESGFIKRILAPYFKDVAHIIPTISTTKHVKTGPDFKGGVTSYERVEGQIRRLLQDTSATIVTTMFDYYGLPSDFPGFGKQVGDCYQRVKLLEKAFEESVKNERFVPYLQLHEFEALLFSAPQVINNIMCGSSSNLLAVRSSVQSPEEINNGRETCPSRRIIKQYPGYAKVVHGQIISEDIGIEAMVEQCPHFSNWVQTLRTICTNEI